MMPKSKVIEIYLKKLFSSHLIRPECPEKVIFGGFFFLCCGRLERSRTVRYGNLQP